MTAMPWGKWFWADWIADSGLRACSAAARGLWMDLLCVAATHEPPGYVAIAGRAMTIDEIARLSGVETAVADRLVSELKSKSVCSQTEDGTMFSRRIIRDHERDKQREKNICKQCGKLYQPQRSSARYCSDTCRQRAHRIRNRNRDVTVTVSVTNSVTNVTDNVTLTAYRPTAKSLKDQQNKSRYAKPRAGARAPLARKESKNLPFSDPDYERQSDPPRASKINAQSPPTSGPATALPDGRAGPPSSDSEASKRPHELTKAEFEAKLDAKRKTGEP